MIQHPLETLSEGSARPIPQPQGLLCYKRSSESKSNACEPPLTAATCLSGDASAKCDREASKNGAFDQHL